MIKTVSISFYGGEPLLNMDFIKQTITYTEKLPDTGRVFNYSMTTNAMLLDKYMDYLVEKDFTILISLDGDEQGQSYRTDHAGNNSFQRVYRNIMLLKEKYPEYWNQKVSFNAVLHNLMEWNVPISSIRNRLGKYLLSHQSIQSVLKMTNGMNSNKSIVTYPRKYFSLHNVRL